METAYSGSSKQARWIRRRTFDNAELGQIPKVQNPDHRQLCKKDLLLFLQWYFPESTGLGPFSDDHVEVIARIQKAILEGGWFAQAVYRGFSKTTIGENSALWAVLYGHTDYVLIFAGEAGLAGEMLGSIKTECETNERLYEDFPEVIHPIRAIEGRAQRCNTQTMNGERTFINWSQKELGFPVIRFQDEEGKMVATPASGAMIRAKGILGASRGLKSKDALGRNKRPGLILIDDFQTDESAGHPSQVKKRVGIIKRGILKSGGHRNRVACIVNGTIIEKGDGMQELTDPEQHQAVEGVRIPMVRKFADAHDSHWLGTYQQLRTDYDPEQPGAKGTAWAAANAYYAEKREAMDAGAEVSWRSCYDPEWEASAVQHAYNELIDYGPEVFASECQGDPLDPVKIEVELLTPRQIASKQSGLKRGRLPLEATKLTAYVDVQKSCFYYTVCAWAPGFSGWVVFYSVFPEQRRDYFTLSSLRQTLQTLYPGLSVEAQIKKGLRSLIDQLSKKRFRRDDGQHLQVDLGLVDSSWKTKEVKGVLRDLRLANWKAATGQGIKAVSNPLNDPRFRRKAGEIRGDHWKKPAHQDHYVIDTNFWKTFTHARFLTDVDEQSTLKLYQSTRHRLWAEHQRAEYPTIVEADGHRVEEWNVMPGRPDNHYFDTMVGNCCAASILGICLPGEQPQARRRRRTSLTL